MKAKSLLLIAFILIISGRAFSQGVMAEERKKIDSLKTEWKKADNPEMKDSVQTILDKLYEATALRIRNSGDLLQTEKVLLEAMESAKKGGHMNAYRSLHVNLGLTLKEMGRNAEAIACYRKALKMKFKDENSVTTGTILNNLGSLYYDDEQFDKAFEYFIQAAEYRVKNGDPYAADAYWNLSFAYLKNRDTMNYIRSLEKAGKMYKAMNNDYGNSSWHFTVGAIAQQNGEYEKADKEFRLAAQLYRKLGFAEYVAWSYFGIARANKRLKNKMITEKYADSSYQLAHAIKSYERIKNASELLTEINIEKGNHKRALEFYRRYIQVRDTIQNLNNSKALIRSEAQIKYDKKFTADSVVHAKEKEISKEKIARQESEIALKRNQQFLLFGGLTIVLVFAFFMYNRFKITQRQKNLIEKQKQQVEEQNVLIQHQKQEVEEKNKEITDSINYAKRIQEAILPSRYSLTENLKNGFVLYKPKDIVAGDFYWLEKIQLAVAVAGGSHEKSMSNYIFFAAADCTGHGVPGAMVSVVCSNAISKALLEDGITETGKILDRTRELVIERFSKSEENVKDGMDISLCRLDRENMKIQWSGANNPLWIVRASMNPAGEQELIEPKSDLSSETSNKNYTHSEYTLLEVKADKQPIGNYADAKPFTTHDIELVKDDIIYIFTDGFEDQFGGEKGKKFKAAKMKELFLSIQNLSMEEQKNEINETFEKWKGDLEQVDDVCIIGVRL